MKRVVIVGSPGTGKTTLAVRLAAKTGLPVVHLDFYYHQRQYDYYHDKPAWFAKVRQLVQAPQWIMDGNYSSTMVERFAAADIIIFLDFSRWTALRGVLKRRLHFRNKQRSDMPTDWTEKADLAFLRYVWNFTANKRPAIVAALQAHPHKEVLIFTNRAQVQKYLDQL